MKVLGINITIFGILLFSPAIIYRMFTKVKPRFAQLTNQTNDQRAYYPTYENKQFSIELFNEWEKLSTDYRSFIGWKREKLNLKYTNIEGPYNARKSLGEAINNSVWFFGGSTMWGIGSSDIQTIPSHFNSLTNFPVYNFGETGWNSRQSLNQLINVIGDNNKPTAVIFYDGVNDVIHQCRTHIKLLPSHSREKQIQNALKGPSTKKRLTNFIVAPYVSLAKNLNIQLPVFKEVNYKIQDCEINQTKALSIAKHIVNNWRTAYILSKTYGFEFYGILQPTLFTTKTNSEYFPASEVKKNIQREIQYNAVYPLILKEIKSYCEADTDFCASIIDGTDWLDETSNIFIDYCHINSFGNKVIAKRIKSLLKK